MGFLRSTDIGSLERRLDMIENEFKSFPISKDVPLQMYSLDGLRDGECFCAINNGSTWDVVYAERGKITEIAKGVSEHEVYDVICKEFASMYGW